MVILVKWKKQVMEDRRQSNFLDVKEIGDKSPQKLTKQVNPVPHLHKKK